MCFFLLWRIPELSSPALFPSSFSIIFPSPIPSPLSLPSPLPPRFCPRFCPRYSPRFRPRSHPLSLLALVLSFPPPFLFPSYIRYLASNPVAVTAFSPCPSSSLSPSPYPSPFTHFCPSGLVTFSVQLACTVPGFCEQSCRGPTNATPRLQR